MNFSNPHFHELEQHLNHTDIMVTLDGLPIMKYNSIDVIQYGRDNKTIFEHLGFIHELCGKFKKPYEFILQEFIKVFKERTKHLVLPESKITMKIPEPKPVKKKAKKVVK